MTVEAKVEKDWNTHASSDSNNNPSAQLSLTPDSTQTKPNGSAQAFRDDLVPNNDRSNVYTIENLQKWRRDTHDFLEKPIVQMIIIALIVVNSIQMGVGTFDFVTEDKNVEAAFEAIDLAFLIIFTVEIVAHIFADGYRVLCNGWLTFDLSIVVLSWVSNYAMTDDEGDGGADLQVLRAFRIFRAFRLITRVKIMRELVAALLDTLPRMSAIFFLFSIVLYIFAVLFTDLYKDLEKDENASPDLQRLFSRLDLTLFTLFQIMTMDGWSDIARDVMELEPIAWLPFIVFVLLSSFVVINLVIAVICEAIAENHENEDPREVIISAEDAAALEQVIVRIAGGPSRPSSTSSDTAVTRDVVFKNSKTINSHLEEMLRVLQELSEQQERTEHGLDYICRQLQMTRYTNTTAGSSLIK